ncbi:hypothetical protein CCAX7_34010 [Capsulimonas corticalis]|uniref:Uncharacterized protein n=1 Tax=Capsulimonas corticalis TaxID=2219043 RepID=A0A402CYH4_9BACT|nr:ABC transporter permease [Capsulimonas corticalis]BDI31350.1 hypothetical protein CCAX7_34010 [Capsulimonas corticalis]
MNTLIRKELREIRIIPLGMTILFILANICWALWDFQERRGAHPEFLPFSVNALLGMGMVCCFISSALCGSSLFCGEIGSGTLSFLTMLPVRRNTIWLSKVIAGLTGVFTTFFGVLSVSAITSLAHENGAAQLHTVLGALHDPSTFWTSLGSPVLIAIGCFAVSLTVSLLLDGALASALLSIAACICVPGVVAETINLATGYFLTNSTFVALVSWILMSLIPPAFFAASFYIFVNGETLRSKKRFLLLGKSLALWALVSAIVAAGMYLSLPAKTIS